MEMVLRLSVRRDLAEAPQFHLPAGELGRTERTAFTCARESAPDLMEASAMRPRGDRPRRVRYGLSREEAYALRTVAADLRIHEVVDVPNWVVGASCPKRSSTRRRAMTAEVSTRNPEQAGALRRELRFWEAIALSIAIMAPTAAMALNGTLPAQLVGRAVPLAFIFATVGVIFVSYAFIRLSQHFSHAGSVYAFSGVDARAARGLLLGLGAARHLPRLHGGLDRGGRALRRGLLPRHRDLGRRRMAPHRARRRRADRVLRLRRHPRRDALAARHRGDLGARSS